MPNIVRLSTRAVRQISDHADVARTFEKRAVTMPNTVVDPALLPAWYFRSFPEDEPPCRWEPVLTVVAGPFDTQLPDATTVEQFERSYTRQIDAMPGAYLKTRLWQRICLRCEQAHDAGEECEEDPDRRDC